MVTLILSACGSVHPVISHGLPNKEARDALLKELVVPENLPGLAPPKIE